MVARIKILALTFSVLVLVACAVLPAATQPEPVVELPAGMAETEMAKSLALTQSAGPTPIPARIEPESAQWMKEADRFEVNLPGRLSWSSDSKLVGVMVPDGALLFDTSTLQTVVNVLVQQPITMLDFAPDSRLILTTSDLNTLEVRHALNGQTFRAMDPGEPFFTAMFSPDGRWTAFLLQDRMKISVWDVERGAEDFTLEGFESEDPVYNAFYSNDGRFMIWVSRNTVQVQNVSNDELGAVLTHEELVNHAAVSNDDRFLAVATMSTVSGNLVPAVQLWNPISGQPLGVLLTGSDVVRSVAFNSSSRIVAAAAGNFIYLWDLATRKELAKLAGHSSEVLALRFSPDGTVLASTGADNTVRLWRTFPP